MRGIVQIAGVADRAEAMMLVEAGVEQIGFPLGLPVHREDIAAEDAAQIIRRLPPPASGVLITYLNKAERILDLCKEIGARKVQLHGGISIAEIVKLKSLDPDLTVIKSLIVEDNNLAELESSVAAFGPHCDAFITDTYDPATGACGAQSHSACASGGRGRPHGCRRTRREKRCRPRQGICQGGARGLS